MVGMERDRRLQMEGHRSEPCVAIIAVAGARGRIGLPVGTLQSGRQSPEASASRRRRLGNRLEEFSRVRTAFVLSYTPGIFGG